MCYHAVPLNSIGKKISKMVRIPVSFQSEDVSVVGMGSWICVCKTSYALQLCLCVSCECHVTQGAGCSLMDRRTRFESIVRGMTAVASCPVTVKMRTGVHHRNWNAHKLLPRLQDWGVAMATVSVVLPTEVGLFVSGTECANHFFSSTAFPSSFFLPSSFLPFLGFFSFFFSFFLLSLLFYLLPLLPLLPLPLSPSHRHGKGTREIERAEVHEAGWLGVHIPVCHGRFSSASVWLRGYPVVWGLRATHTGPGRHYDRQVSGEHNVRFFYDRFFNTLPQERAI